MKNVLLQNLYRVSGFLIRNIYLLVLAINEAVLSIQCVNRLRNNKSVAIRFKICVVLTQTDAGLRLFCANNSS